MSTDHTPFPALTPSQRLHLEIYGYVVLEKLLTKGRSRRAPRSYLPD